MTNKPSHQDKTTKTKDKKLHRPDDGWSKCQLAEIGRAHAYLMHEIRRILVTTGLRARRVRSNASLSKKNMAHIESIIEETSAGEKMLRDVLSLIQPEREKPDKVDIASLLATVKRGLAPKAKQAGVRIQLQRAKLLKATVSGINKRLRQALLNIMENSIEAAPELWGLLTIDYDIKNGMVVINIKDNGSGIDPEICKDILKPFFSTKTNGTGLGLTLSKKIIQEHEGRLELRSRPDRGTTTIVRLPLRRSGRQRS